MEHNSSLWWQWNSLIPENGKEPTIDDIAKNLGMEKEEIALSFDAIQDPISLQEPVYKDGAESIFIMDQVSDSKNTDEKWAENLTIAEAMKKLNKREMVIASREDSNFIPITQDVTDDYEQEAISPIICEGDMIGGVVLIDNGEKGKMGEVEQKLIQSAAGFLGRQMEQ